MANGVKPPVALVHGWGGTAASVWQSHGWCEACESLGRTAVLIDILGHGCAPTPHDPVAYSDLAAGVAEQLPVYCDAIGYSLGAKLLLAIACVQPERFRALVLGGIGANVFAPEPGGEAIAQMLCDATAHDVQAAPFARYAIANGNDPLATAACLRRPPNPSITPSDLENLRVPVLLISGQDDALAQPIARLAEHLPLVRQLTLPDVGHLDLPEQHAFRDAALAFIEGKTACL